MSLMSISREYDWLKEIERVNAFCPHFYKDKKEPFEIEMVGWTYFEYSGLSLSSSYILDFKQIRAKYAIEYAVYWDYDIQHLYDLEHVIVYLSEQNEILDVVLSFHGKFYCGTHNLQMDGTHPIIYLQPGKHGMMSDPEYFHLYMDLMECCNQKAGCDGILIPPMFKDKLSTSPELNQIMEAYIKQNYSFIPSLSYVKAAPIERLLLPYEEMEVKMLERLQNIIQMRESKGRTYKK